VFIYGEIFIPVSEISPLSSEISATEPALHIKAVFPINVRFASAGEAFIVFDDRHARVSRFKAHTDRTRFGNATRIFSFQKQKNRQRVKILQDMQTKLLKLLKWSRIFEKH
jgi:hypothetical protein